MNHRISAAIAATRIVAPGYFEKCLAQRCSGAGSSYPLTVEELEKALLTAPWEPYAHPDVMQGCSAFRAPLAGTFGLVDLRSVPAETPVTLADPKGTGFVECEVEGAKLAPVDFTVIILGQEKDQEVVFTFHPGDPVRPSRLPSEGRSGQATTAGAALALGFVWGKLKG